MLFYNGVYLRKEHIYEKLGVKDATTIYPTRGSSSEW